MWRVVFAFVAAAVVGLAGCTRSSPPAKKPSETQRGETAKGEIMELNLTTMAFEAGQPIPKKFTGEGEDVSPMLTWGTVPAGTAELALICDDPDAPRPEPWVHWVIYKIPATASALPENVEKVEKLAEPAGALQGVNSWGKIGYGGPMPPPGHGTHHYHFMLYALDAELDVQPGMEKEALLAAMADHIVGKAELIGTYER
jgi:Raf kinase inhibitor-like YbhB/YbcL family protein